MSSTASVANGFQVVKIDTWFRKVNPMPAQLPGLGIFERSQNSLYSTYVNLVEPQIAIHVLAVKQRKLFM